MEVGGKLGLRLKAGLLLAEDEQDDDNSEYQDGDHDDEAQGDIAGLFEQQALNRPGREHSEGDKPAKVIWRLKP